MILILQGWVNSEANEALLTQALSDHGSTIQQQSSRKHYFDNYSNIPNIGMQYELGDLVFEFQGLVL